MEFGCTGCSICCRLVGASVKAARKVPFGIRTLQQKTVASFPHKVDQDGVCVQLDEKGRCKVYNERPTICRVDRSFEVFEKKSGTTRREYYKKVAQICNGYIQDHKLDDEFLIDLKQYE